DSKLIATCHTLGQEALQRRFDCDEGSLLFNSTEGRTVRRACKAGESAGKNVSLKGVKGYTEAMNLFSAAQAAACNQFPNFYLRTNCEDSASEKFETRISNCGE